MVAKCLSRVAGVMALLLPAFCGVAATQLPAVELTAELRQELYLPPSAPLDPVTLYAAKARATTPPAADNDAPRILQLQAAHVGQDRLWFQVDFARRPAFDRDGLILYLDLDCDPATGRQDSPQHRGVDMLVSIGRGSVSQTLLPPRATSKNASLAAVKQVGNSVLMTLDAPLKIEGGKVCLRAYLASERAGGRSDGTPRDVFTLPAVERKVPQITSRGTPDLRPLSDYRYHNDRVRLEKLADKGLRAEAVQSAEKLEIGRPRPVPLFAATGRKPQQAGAVERQRVVVELLEEDGVARSAAVVSFGFPLPKGGLFDPQRIRILSPGGDEVPAQVAATSFWPDDSVKWALVEFTAPLGPQAAASYAVEFGNAVRRTAFPSPLKVDESGDVLTVATGAIKAQINRRQFHLFDGVWLTPGDEGSRAPALVAASAPEGAKLVDERGKVFTLAGAPPESVRIEEQGPRKVVIRVEGQYAAADGTRYMRYVARLVFRAGSPRVELIYTHTNDYLATEFTDITSLELPLVASGAKPGVIARTNEKAGAQLHAGQAVTLRQWDEKQSQLDLDGQRLAAGQSPGVLTAGAAATPLSAVVHDFWQRWPKGLTGRGDQVAIELLPKQPGPDFGRGLPHQLLFPFVDGFYRFKWGMAFTERITFDFSGRLPSDELLAEAQWPIVPVLPAAWYAQTAALGPLAAPLDKQFALWDLHIARSYADYVRTRDSDRSYGYFNYGDWYGERGRNWGNNEYDLAYGFFQQFARTGRRDYFRLALAAARHQADVDIVHAYPDPYYVGANHQHSIGHTGMWTERPRYGTWTWRYDMHTAADNGHTWSEGMVDAWFLTGEAPVMDAALALGEHITWGMSRRFKALGTHERSAGWSLKAIIGLYRATYDPLYLDAARRIATVALAEQKFDDGGAWPHVLPGDHAGTHPGGRGNAIYLVGIVMQGLADYYRESGDPAVLRSLDAAGGWLLRCWNEPVQGWPYTALVSGEPNFPPALGSNLMAAGPLALAGEVCGKPDYLETAQKALAAVVRSSSSGNGKSIAQQMNYTSGLLATLQRWNAQRLSDQGRGILSGEGDDQTRYLAQTPPAQEHNVRGPNKKVFLVELAGRPGANPATVTARLSATRKPYGAMNKRQAAGTIQVVDAAGKVVAQGQFSTDGPHEFTCPLGGPAHSVFRVVIDDDQRGVWSLAGAGLQILMQVTPGFTIGGVGRGSYQVFVPAGTQEFSLQLRPGHAGQFAGVVLTPAGQIAGTFQATFRPGAKETTTAEGETLATRGEITVRPSAADTGKIWRVVLVAPGDLEVTLKGLPAFMGLDVSAWPGAGR